MSGAARWLCTLVAAGACTGLAAEARGDHHLGERVAVLEVSGPGGRALGRQLRAVVGDGWDLVSSRAYRRIVDDAGELDRDATVMVSRRLGVAAVLAASVRRYRDGDVLEVELVAGSTGVRVSSLSVQLASPRLGRRTRARVRRWLARSIARVRADAGDDGPEEGGGARRSRRPERDQAGSSSGPSRGRLRLAAGPHAMYRSLGFSARPDMVDAPSGLTATGYGVSVQVRAQPFGGGAGARIELECGLDRALSVRSDEGAVDAVSQASESVTSQGWRAGAGLRVWGAAHAAHAMASVRYHRLSFAVAADSSYQTPATDFAFADPGLVVRAPLGATVWGSMEARAVLATAAGPLTRSDNYGAARITGYQLHGGLDIGLGGDVTVIGELSYLAIGLAFDGSGALSSGADGDPATLDVGGALDRYLRATVSLGYRL